MAYFPDTEPHYVTKGAMRRPRPNTHKDKAHHQLLRGVDILIMDAQYERDEYEKHKGWGHACLDDVVALALKAEVKKLFLFHHDPDDDDANISEMADYARKLVKAQNGKMQVDAAREGLVVELAGVATAVR